MNSIIIEVTTYYETGKRVELVELELEPNENPTEALHDYETFLIDEYYDDSAGQISEPECCIKSK